MIKEAYCSFEVSKLLKEKGFDVYGDGSFGSNTEIHKEYSPNGKTINTLYGAKPHKDAYPAPTHQMAMAWLREEKRIFIRIIEACTGEVFRYEIYNHTPDNNGNYYISNIYVDSYEEAVEAALKYTLEKFI